MHETKDKWLREYKQKTGIFHNLTNNEYHDSEGISSSFVKKWLTTTPYHASQPSDDLSPSVVDIGSGVHAMFEGKNRKQSVIGKHKTRAGKQWAEDYQQAKEDGVILLPEGEYAKALQMTKALWKHKDIRKIARNKTAVKEASVYTIDEKTGLLLKARPDLYTTDKGIIMDVKTFGKIPTERNFFRQFIDLAYGYQAAFYKKVCEQEGIQCIYFAFAVVEKKAPHSVNLFLMSQELMRIYSERLDDVLEEIKEAEKTGDYSTGWPSFTMLHPAEWMDTQL
tara:strand:+ start:1850 stop:2689 length:840 start_codon:yes stop_codon:yes gene_type:complete